MAHARTRSRARVHRPAPGGCFIETRFMQASSNCPRIPIPRLLMKSAIKMYTVMSRKLLTCLDRIAHFSSPHLHIGQVILHLNFHLMVRFRKVGKALVL